MEEIPLPKIKEGDDARALTARHRSALVEANGNLRCSKKWYNSVRKGYGKSK
jgi:hypothetical protein